MHKKSRHSVRNHPTIFQRVVNTDNTVHESTNEEVRWTEGQIRFVRDSATTLNQETERVLDTIAGSLKAKLASILSSEENADRKHIKIEVYMPMMCSPFCIENESGEDQVIHINAPIQFSPVRITNIDDEPAE